MERSPSALPALGGAIVKPEFVDNRDGNTLLRALRQHLSWLADTYVHPVELSIATGYFNPQAYALLADHLESLVRVRLLLGAEPTPPPARPKRKPGDPRRQAYDAQLVKQALSSHEQGLEDDRNILGFTTEVDATLQRLLDFLDSGRIEVRRYEQSFLHGKAFIFNDEEGVIAGSSNFTAAGLTSNLELNLGRYDPYPVQSVHHWFDELWEDAVPYDLRSVYAARYVAYAPYLIYLRVLWELYGAELESEATADGTIPLTTFQQDGILRAKRIMREHNGVVIADGVGLGKTFIGGELIREAVSERRQRALLIAPAALRDGTWERFQTRFQLYFEKLSYEQLADEAQLGGERFHLRQNKNEYALIVIDEAQAFRNPDTKRSQALRRLLQGTPPKNLVLLTATPVNNSLWDLYYLLTYFVGHDAAFADRGIRSLKERFQEAVGEDPYELRPDTLFDILDATTVRRTRHFVRTYYPDERIPDPGGEMVRIRFPEPHLNKAEYNLDAVLPGFFDRFAAALVPMEGARGLSLARYWPSQYRLATPPDERGVALVGLLRSGLLKRFESSAHAFSLTASRMATSHDAFLAALDQGYIPTPEAIDEWTETDTDEAFEQLLQGSGAISAQGYDVDRLRRDVERDRDILQYFAQTAESVEPRDDPKLQTLADELAEIVEQAREDALTDADFTEKRKVIIFSYFADTVDWIEDYLLCKTAQDERLACYQGRIASVTSANSRRGISRTEAVFGFAPHSTEAPEGLAEDRFDILITTDVLAEGQNLQQCRNIINYDLPWNPMRLVQRNGRIDRIGSPHSDIYIRCFFPDHRLDDLLELELRIRLKLAQAAATIGVENGVIPEGATSDLVYAETKQEIERLRAQDPSLFVNGGEDPAAYSAEEYRQELRKGLSVCAREIRELPWAAGSGIARGPRKGIFFCARIGDRVFLRFVPTHEYAEIVRNTLECLKSIHCTAYTERHMAEDVRASAYQAWGSARKDIYDEWLFATDPANLQPRIRPVFRRAAEHLRTHPPIGIDQQELERTLDTLEAPWAGRIERQIRSIIEAEDKSPIVISRELVEKVHELGLEPFVPPQPLPVIAEDEVELICWMAVDTETD